MTTNVSTISAGYNHTLVVKTDNTLWACGNTDRYQLGDDLNPTAGQDYQTTLKNTVVDVRAANAGFSFSLIIKTDNSLYSCGNNYNGQLGDGTLGNGPVDHFGKLTQIATDVYSVVAGADHSMVLKNDGSLFVCGLNSSGQLGDGGTARRPTLYQINY
jgi:alpha-tubulin suppressor-like RCC1 family protein